VYWKREPAPHVGRTKGQLSWADALYMKRISELDAMFGRLPSRPARQAKSVKAAAISALFGYFDRALAVVEASASVLDSAQRQELERALRSLAPKDPLPQFPGRRRLANALYRAWRYLEPKRGIWETIGSGLRLGNFE
jgi:hypothetical protein